MRERSDPRPSGPEGSRNEIDGVSPGGFDSQPAVIPRGDDDADSDGLAQNAPDATPFGAPVVHDLPPDPGPHEKLLTVREVAGRLGVSAALVYKLCQRDVLRSLRVGGALRFLPAAIDEYLVGGPRR
jgi:excisionase family DNA binding protein